MIISQSSARGLVFIEEAAMQNNRSDLCEGPLLKKIILYTVPIILTGILQLLFNAADLVVVGRYCGELSVAAVGATGALINLIINLFIGLSVGAGVTVAHGLGAGKEENVRRTVRPLSYAASYSLLWALPVRIPSSVLWALPTRSSDSLPNTSGYTSAA